MSAHYIKQFLTRTKNLYGEEAKQDVINLYDDNVKTLKLMGFENARSVSKTATVLAQAQFNGTLDRNVVDVERLNMAYKTQNFFEKYDRKALDDYLLGKIDYQTLKAKIEHIKKVDERYLKENYSKR